jgi:hypothetical protein
MTQAVPAVTSLTNPNTSSPDLSWIAPSQRASPADALARIQAICDACPELFSAMLAVYATHQGVPREILAAAVKQFRRDTDSLTREDVVGLLTALWNGGKQGFETVLRTRRNPPRTSSATAGLPWAAG